MMNINKDFQKMCICGVCEQLTKYIYINNHNIYVCQKCLIDGETNRSFPKGKGCYVACPLCYNWFFQNTYGHILENCGQHDDHDDNMYLSDLFNN